MHGGAACVARGDMHDGGHTWRAGCRGTNGHCSGRYASYWKGFLFRMIFKVVSKLFLDFFLDQQYDKISVNIDEVRHICSVLT